MLQPTPIITIILAILLLAATAFGLHAKTEKYVTYGLIASRILIFAVLVTTIVSTASNFPAGLWIGIVRVVWQFLTSLMLESAYRRKRQTFGSPRLSGLSLVAILIVLILAL